MELEQSSEVSTESQPTSPAEIGAVGVEHGETKSAEGVAKPEGQLEAGQPLKPAYQPNYKYKVLDKEFEIPKEFQAFIKDETSEKLFRDVFTKAQGLESVKAERQQLTQKYQEAEGKIEQVTHGLQKLAGYAKNDLDTFFEIYKIPEDKIIDWVRNRLELAEDPQKAQAWQQQRQLQRQAEEAQERASQVERENRELFMTTHQRTMQQVLTHPQVTSFRETFNAQFGQGEFERQVNEYGDRIWRMENRYADPTECVRAVHSYFSKVINPLGMQAQQQQPQGQPQTAEPQEKPATIPNIGQGRAVSPTKAKFKNLDQLRAYANQMTQEG